MSIKDFMLRHRQLATSIGAGATEIQKNIIAKKAIKLPRK